VFADKKSMLCNTDYAFRRMSGVYQHPKNRLEVDDVLFDSYVNLQGGHQTMIDVSRCINVSSPRFDQMGQCLNVMYLDLSFTRIANIEAIAENCVCLRSLLLAGTKELAHDAFEPLSKLAYLELLSLRGARNVDSQTVTLCQDMLTLRSLDLGHTQVTSITCLRKLTRLEELVLDSTQLCNDNSSTGGNNSKKNASSSSSSSTSVAAAASIDEAFEDTLECLACMTSLRVLNLRDTQLTKHSRDILAVLHEDLCLEPKSRREQFLEAIIANDEPVMRRLATSGEDIDMRIGAWATELMTHAWRTRCKTPKLQTPFFLVNSDNHEFLPTPLHLAIFFNATNCLATLLFLGANQAREVWCGDVLEDETTHLLVRDDAKCKPVNVVVRHKTSELPRFMFDRNVHRLTENMIGKKLTNWKDICRGLFVDIKEHILEGKFCALQISKEAERARLKAIEDAKRAREALKAAKKEAKRKEREIAERKRLRDLGEEIPKTEDGKEVALVAAEVSSDEEEEEAPVVEEASVASLDSATAAGGGASAVYVKPGRKKLQMLAPKLIEFNWLGHSMVARLIGEPLVFKASLSGADVRVLGKKSFWLEGRAQTLERRLIKEAKDEADLKERAAQDYVLAATLKRIQKQKGLKDYVPQEPEPVRKADFLAAVDHHVSRKYVVRDDVEDEGGREDQSDDDKSM